MSAKPVALFGGSRRQSAGPGQRVKSLQINTKALNNIISHTNTHNRMVETQEMWAAHKKEQEIKAKDLARRYVQTFLSLSLSLFL